MSTHTRLMEAGHLCEIWWRQRLECPMGKVEAEGGRSEDEQRDRKQQARIVNDPLEARSVARAANLTKAVPKKLEMETLIAIETGHSMPNKVAAQELAALTEVTRSEVGLRSNIPVPVVPGQVQPGRSSRTGSKSARAAAVRQSVPQRGALSGVRRLEALMAKDLGQARDISRRQLAPSVLEGDNLEDAVSTQFSGEEEEEFARRTGAPAVSGEEGFNYRDVIGPAALAALTATLVVQGSRRGFVGGGKLIQFTGAPRAAGQRGSGKNINMAARMFQLTGTGGSRRLEEEMGRFGAFVFQGRYAGP